MQNLFDLVARGGTAPTSSSNKQQVHQYHKHTQGNEQLDDIPIGWRPKTISGGGDANDLADFNTSLRHNKITSSVLDNRGEAVADTSSHEYAADLDGDEYLKAMESFQAAVDSWSFQKDLTSGPQPPKSPIPAERSSGGATGAGIGIGAANKRPESRSRANKESKKLSSHGLLSAYTQNVPNIVLQSQQQSQASKKRDGSATTSRSAAGNSAAGSGGSSNSSNASPRPNSRDKDAKFVNSSSVYINEIKAVYGNIDFTARPSAPNQSLLSKPKMFPPKASSSTGNSGSSGGRPPSLKSPLIRQLDSPGSLSSPAQRIPRLDLDGEAYPNEATGREAASSPKLGKVRKKMKTPSLLKSSLESRPAAIGATPAATVMVARNDSSKADEQVLTDSDERSSPNEGTIHGGGQLGDFCPQDSDYIGHVAVSESSSAVEADGIAGSSALMQLNLTKRKDKADSKRDGNVSSRSPGINKRGMLARSPSGLQLIMEDNDELVEQLDAASSNFDDIVMTTISTPLPVDMKIRPQSRKLYLGSEGISSYGVHSASGGTPAAMPTIGTSEPVKMSAQLQPAMDSGSQSARPKFAQPAVQRYNDDADLAASESRTRLATLPSSGSPVEKPVLKKMHSFNQAIKPNPWEDDDLSQVRPPSRQRSAFPVHLVDVPPQNINTSVNGSTILGPSVQVQVQAPPVHAVAAADPAAESTKRSTSDHLLLATTKSPRLYQPDFEVDTSCAAGVVVATNPIKVSAEGLGLRVSASRRSLPDPQQATVHDDEASVASSNSKANRNRPPSRQKIAAQNLFEGFDVTTPRDAPDRGKRSDGPLSISKYDIGTGPSSSKYFRAEKEVSSAPLYSRSVPNTALGASSGSGSHEAGSSSTYQPSIPRNRANTTRGVGLGSLYYDPKDDGFSDIDLADVPFFIQVNNSDHNDDFIESSSMLESNYQYSFDKLVRSTSDLVIVDEGGGAGPSKGKGPPPNDYDGSRNSSAGGKAGSKMQVEADKYSSPNYFYTATKNVHDKSKSVRNTRGMLGGGSGGTGSGSGSGSGPFHIATTFAAAAASSAAPAATQAVNASTRLGAAVDVSGQKDGWTEAHHREATAQARSSTHVRTHQIHSPPHQSENYSNRRFNSNHADSDVEDDEITIMTEESHNDCIMEASMSLQSFALDSSLGEDFLSLFAPAEN